MSRRSERRAVDRLLSGLPTGEGAEQQVASLARALADLRPGPASAALPGEQVTVAAMAEAIRSGTGGRAPSGRSRRVRPRVAIIGLAAALVLSTAGLAVAGVLPDPAQDAARKVFSRVGITIPPGRVVPTPTPDADRADDSDGRREDSGRSEDTSGRRGGSDDEADDRRGRGGDDEREASNDDRGRSGSSDEDESEDDRRGRRGSSPSPSPASSPSGDDDHEDAGRSGSGSGGGSSGKGSGSEREDARTDD